MDAPLSKLLLSPAETQLLWSIAEVERDTGLGKDTLRVWERRYGFPQPVREGAGDRLYPLEQLQRLRRIRRLMDAGHRPGKVVPLHEEALQALLAGLEDKSGTGRQMAPATGAGMAPADSLATGVAQSWLQWLIEDRHDLVRQGLQQQILRQGLGATVEALVAPLCVHVGEAWLRGELSVYQEHLFTETLQAVLREAIASVDASGVGMQHAPRVLLTTVPGEQHGLGLLMAECFFALESCTRYVLGISTPIADTLLALKQLRIDVLALSFSAYCSRRDMLESLAQLMRQLPAGVEIWVGGTAASLHSRAIPKGIAVLRGGGDLAAQVQAWRQRHVQLR